MDKIKNAAASTKKFVEDHKVAIAVTLTAAICLKLNRVALKDHDNFLEEHGLLEKFYTPTPEEL